MDRSKLYTGVVLLLIVFASATIAYAEYETIPLSRSAYYMVMTITTVGAPYDAPQTTGGMVVSAGAVVLGMGLVLYLVGSLASVLIEDSVKLRKFKARHHRKKKKKSEKK